MDQLRLKVENETVNVSGCLYVTKYGIATVGKLIFTANVIVSVACSNDLLFLINHLFYIFILVRFECELCL